ncbi:extracellular solute-binding protein [Floricoccus penangensis]|uniref:extracellular solute-binding protein n=1 Tax=Floricoccus penangensis TaxID=1859475 RepID=UPI0020425A0A|nr:extracellular solute-binding protein [Floricoccus penangensis]URZ86885.1 extracellular solute-binding protein [Floricoccus penangensis]
MKLKRLYVLIFSFFSILSLSACSKENDNVNANDTKPDVITKLTGNTEITFWHAMNGPLEEALTKITEDFMEENPNIKVNLQNQGDYSALHAKINTTAQNPKNFPTISQAYPGWIYSLAVGGQLEDLKPYFENDTIGWGNQPKIKQSFLDGAKIEGVQYGISFNKSTEVLYYNADLLKEYNLNIPKTMDELREVSKVIYEKSNGQIKGAGFDSFSVYHTIGLKDQGITFSEDTKFDSKESCQVIDFYADGVDQGYFTTAGSDKSMTIPFVNEKVAMFIGSISRESFVKKDSASKFQYNVAARPSVHNIQQGTDIYTFASASDEQKTAAFLFMKYLSKPEVQLYWSQKTGYMPTVEEVLNSDKYQDSKESKVPAVINETTKNLIVTKDTKNSDAAYAQVNASMAEILSSPASDREKLIKKATIEIDDTWKQ